MVRGYSELRVVLTARNEASRTLRRVGKDISRIGQQDMLKTQISQLQNVQKRIKSQRDLVASELASLTTGKQRLALDKQIAAQKTSVKRAQDAVKRALDEENKLVSRNQQQQIATQRQYNEVTKRLSSKRLSDFRREQLEMRKTELETQRRRLETQASRIPLATTRARADVRTQNLGLRALGAANDELARKADVARDRMRNLASQIDLVHEKELALKKELDSLDFHKLRQGASSAMHLGLALATVGAIATTTFGLAAKGAAEFSKQITLAATQARPIGKSFAFTATRAQQLNDIVLKQMQKFPAASQEMADALYEIFSGSNIDKPRDAAAALETLNKAAVAGGASLKTMTEAGLTLLNNFVGPAGSGKEFSNLNQAMDVFFSAVRYGRFSADQFANSLSNIIPIAQTAGLTFRDVADAMAILTRQAGARSTSRDATGLARLIDILNRAEVQQGLAMKGVQVEGPKGMRPLLDIIRDIKKQIDPKTGADLNQFFKTISAAGGAASGSKGLAGTQQARRVFDYLIQNVDEYGKVADKVNKTQGEFNKSFQAMAKTPGVRWDVLVNQMKALLIIIGTEAIPAFEKLGFIIVKVLHYFNNMDPDTRRLIVTFGVFASVGALVVGALTSIVGALALGALALGRFGKMAGVFGGAGAEAGFVSTKFGILGGAAAALILIIGKYPHIITQVTDAFGGLGNTLKVLGHLITIFTIAKIISSLSAISAGAFLATSRVVALRLALLRLSVIGAIAVPIVLELSRKFDEDPRSKSNNKLEKWWLQGLRGFPVVGKPLESVAKAGGELGRMVTDRLGISDQARAQKKRQQEITRMQGMVNISQGMGTLQTILNSPFVPDYLKDAARRAFLAGDSKTINAILHVINLPFKKGLQEGLATHFSSAEKVAVKTATDQQFVTGLTNLNKLKQVSEKAAPGMPALRAWKAYQAALDALVARFPQYKDAINDLLQAFDKVAEIRMPDAAFAKAFARLNKMRKKLEDSTDPKAIEKYHKLEDALTKKSSDSQMQAAQEAAANADRLHDEQVQKAKDAADKAKQLAEEAADKAKQLAQQAADRAKQNAENARNALQTISQSLFSFYQNAKQENQAMMGQLFSGPFMNSAVMQNRNQFGFSARPKDLLADMFSQVTQFKKFQNSLTSLRQRGAPDELVSQVRQLGPEAQKQIDALNKLNPAQFKKYVGFFNSGQKMIEQATQADLNRQVKKWESFGKKVARAIMLGISSETPGIENALYNRILKMFPGLAAQGHAKPKSIPLPGGGSIKPTASKGGKTPQYQIINNKTVHYNLPAHLAGSSLAGQLKASYFHERTRGD